MKPQIRHMYFFNAGPRDDALPARHASG